MKISPLFSAWPFATLSLCAFLLYLFVGCSTALDKSGPYAGDQYLYATDVTITSAYSILDAFVKFEYENRAALAGNPAIRQAADNVRLHAKQWITSAIAIREAYAANPSTANKASLDQAIAVLQAALNEAVKYLAAPPAAPPATAPPTTSSTLLYLPPAYYAVADTF